MVYRNDAWVMGLPAIATYDELAILARPTTKAHSRWKNIVSCNPRLTRMPCSSISTMTKTSTC